MNALKESSATTENAKKHERVQFLARPVQNLKEISVTTENRKKMNAFKLMPAKHKN